MMAWVVALSAHAFSFSTVIASGQTLYFTVTGDNTVKVVAPATMSWDGYTAPVGALVIPSSVVHDGVTYGVTAIDKMAFQQCYDLTYVSIPGSVVSIGQNAFAQDTMLVTAVMDEGVQRIDRMAFYGCSALDTIELPSTLTRIAVYAFMNTAYYNNLENWSSELMLTLGEWVLKVRSIATGTVHVHEGVAGVANNAFDLCEGVDKVILPTTMRIIGDFAFKDCSSLDSVILNSVTPPTLSDDSFEGVVPLPILAVPCSTATTYGAAQLWSSFTIVEMPCPVAVDEVEPVAPATVSLVRGGVVVRGAEGGPLTVCDAMGRKVCRVLRASDMQYLPLPAAGVYVLLLPDGGSLKISYSR